MFMFQQCVKQIISNVKIKQFNHQNESKYFLRPVVFNSK